MDNCVINLESTEEYLKTPLKFQVLDWMIEMKLKKTKRFR